MAFPFTLFCEFLIITLVKSENSISYPAGGSSNKASYNLLPIPVSNKNTEVAALGRVANLGDLYDARTDQFIGISLYEKRLSGDAVYSTDDPYSKVDLVKTESLTEKIEKLNIQASVSASFLCGIIKVSGSAEYLNTQKKSRRSAKTSLIYRQRTVVDGLRIFSEASKKLMSMSFLKNIDATHVVVGIEYGANVVLSVEETNTDASNKLKIQGKLEIYLLKSKSFSFSGSGGGGGNYTKFDVEKSDTFSLRLHGDIIPDTIPQTISESMSFIRNIPNLIKNQNGGKGKMMNYILMPLSTVRKVFKVENDITTTVKDLYWGLVIRLTFVSEELKNSEFEINDFYGEIATWSLMFPENELEKISIFKSKFESFKDDFTLKLADMLVRFRNGSVEGKTFLELIDSYKKTNWTMGNIKKYLENFQKTMNKIYLLNLLQQHNAFFIDRRTNKYEILAKNYRREIRIISVNLGINISSIYVQEIVQLLEMELKKGPSAIKYYIEDINISVPTVRSYFKGNVIDFFHVVKKEFKEYVFLSSISGKVTILDANSYVPVILYNYTLPQIDGCIVAFVNKRFYSIDTLKGKILSTPIKNLMVSTPSSAMAWTQVGCFPAESRNIVSSSAVNDLTIYFVTYSGVIYVFDTVKRKTTKLSNIPKNDKWDFYASAVVINGILYVQKHNNFYSFDGATVQNIPTPDDRYLAGLFQSRNRICRVGGNATNNYPDPVACYNPKDGSWEVISFINEARRAPAIANTRSGALIFGGTAFYESTGFSRWRNSAEVYNDEQKTWYYTSHFLRNSLVFPQAITIYF